MKMNKIDSSDIDTLYPYIVQEVMKHIEEVKKTDNEISLFDIILDFCFKRDLQVELVGDAIQSDIYFKSFIEKDCAVNGMMRVHQQEMEEW
jgi:hypothetical protein